MHEIIPDNRAWLIIQKIMLPHRRSINGHEYTIYRGWLNDIQGVEVALTTKNDDPDWNHVVISEDLTRGSTLELEQVLVIAHDAYHARPINGSEHVPNQPKNRAWLEALRPDVTFTKSQAQQAGFSRFNVERVFKKFFWNETVTSAELLDGFMDEFVSMFVNDLLRRKELSLSI